MQKVFSTRQAHIERLLWVGFCRWQSNLERPLFRNNSATITLHRDYFDSSNPPPLVQV